MNHNPSRKLPIFVGLFALGLAGLTAYAASAWTIVGYQVAGKTVTAQVHNTATRAISGTVYVQVVHGGQTYTGVCTAMTIQANGTVPVSIVVGTITDDVTPMDRIILGTITDDLTPF